MMSVTGPILHANKSSRTGLPLPKQPVAEASTLPPSLAPSPIPGLRAQQRRRAFTFVEMLVALGVMVLFAATTLASLTQFNRFAVASRLRAHALSLAQQRVDEVLTTGWTLTSTPPVLAVGTRTESNIVLNADSTNTQTSLKSLFTDLVKPVTGTRTTTVTSISTRLVRADVTVTFTYANHTYTVAMTTMRTMDNF